MGAFIDKQKLLYEVRFQASRSSGSGGQHVNKVNTKVELRFDISNSQYFTDQQKEILWKKLANRITTDGILIVTSEASRSQLKNKEDCISKFYEIINNALTPRKSRIATRPSKKAKIKRLESKKKQAEKKELRKRPKL